MRGEQPGPSSACHPCVLCAGEEAAGQAAAAAGEQQAAGGHKKRRLEDLSIDEFLAGGFEDSDIEFGGGSEGDDEGAGHGGSDSEGDGDAEGGESEEEDEAVVAAEAAAAAEADGSGSESEGGSDSEDEGEEGAAAPSGAKAAAKEVGKRNKALRGEVATHKAELDRLRERDPEFYEYLKVSGVPDSWGGVYYSGCGSETRGSASI